MVEDVNFDSHNNFCLWIVDIPLWNKISLHGRSLSKFIRLNLTHVVGL